MRLIGIQSWWREITQCRSHASKHWYAHNTLTHYTIRHANGCEKKFCQELVYRTSYWRCCKKKRQGEQKSEHLGINQPVTWTFKSKFTMSYCNEGTHQWKMLAIFTAMHITWSSISRYLLKMAVLYALCFYAGQQSKLQFFKTTNRITNFPTVKEKRKIILFFLAFCKRKSCQTWTCYWVSCRTSILSTLKLLSRGPQSAC